MSNRLFGLLLIALAGIHQAVGLYEFHDSLFEAISIGWWASQDRTELSRAVMFWFFAFGFLIALWGEALRRRTGAIHPIEWGGGALMALAGATAIPESGFWLVMLVCLIKGWSDWRRTGVAVRVQ